MLFRSILHTARSIAAAQRPDGAIPWPDGHVDPWDHVECAMALSACGLAVPARLAYKWLRDTQLSDEYHEVSGGHVRIFTRAEVAAKLTAAGLTPTGSHHAHGLHSAYWWLKCAVGVHDDAHPAVRAYHRLLVWDIMSKPALTRLSEAALNPLIGKSLVIYARKIKTAQPVTQNELLVPVNRNSFSADQRNDSGAGA